MDWHRTAAKIQLADGLPPCTQTAPMVGYSRHGPTSNEPWVPLNDIQKSETFGTVSAAIAQQQRGVRNANANTNQPGSASHNGPTAHLPTAMAAAAQPHSIRSIAGIMGALLSEFLPSWTSVSQPALGLLHSVTDGPTAVSTRAGASSGEETPLPLAPPSMAGRINCTASGYCRQALKPLSSAHFMSISLMPRWPPQMATAGRMQRGAKPAQT